MDFLDKYKNNRYKTSTHLKTITHFKTQQYIHLL